MGIQGLSTFLNQYHARYNTSLCIRDSLIVVDGNNLMYYLLSNPCGINAHLVSGDCIFYAKRVREFFQHVKDCQIVPIVIFDGAHEPEKWKTVFKRYRDTLKANVHSHMPGNSYTPVAMSTVFREILVEQGILHYQTELEADDTMAFIAKRLQCPLLSSDSDFYIYPNIQNIPLSAIEFRKSLLKKDKSGQKKVHVMTAKVLSIERLCKEEFKFKDLRLLPLAPVILGNDRISTSTFANLHKDKAADKIHRIKFVFEWLGKHRDYDHVLTVILKSLKEAERVEMLSLVKSVLENYQGEHGELAVWNLLVKDLKLNLEIQDEGPEPPNTAHLWYLPLHRNCTFPTYLLNILRNRTLLLQPSVEISHFPSTHEVSLDVIRVTAGILLGDAELMLVTRQRKNPITLEVTTLTGLPGFGQIPTIQEPKFRNKALALLHSVFQLNDEEIAFINQWPVPLKYLLSCLLFFFKKMSRWSIARPMAVAILLSYLKPIFICNQIKEGRDDSTNVLSEQIRRQAFTKRLADFFAVFDAPAAFTKTHPYDISFVYVYSQFQCLLVHSIMLSKLLGNPYRLPKLQQLNSHFTYNVIRTIVQSHHKNPTNFLQLYFGNSRQDRNVLAIFDQFFRTVSHMKKGKEIGAQGNEEAVAVEDTSCEDAEEESANEDEINDFISSRFAKLKLL